MGHCKAKPIIMPIVETQFRAEAPPAPFLIHDYIHDNYTRPPLLIAGPGNIGSAHRVRDALSLLVCKRNDVKTGLRSLLEQDMYDEPVGRFPDGHAKVQIRPECTQRHVFILQGTYPNPDERLMEVFHMADAARKAGASEVTAILPYYAYGRGDRKTRPREPIAASLIARLLTQSGVTRIITEDIHADQTTGSVPEPWDNLYASVLMIPELGEMVNPQNTVVMSPDAGGMKRAIAYKKRLGARGVAHMIKDRDLDEQSSSPESLVFVGKVQGREVIIVDDESVSFSSLTNAARAAADNGAVRIIISLSHLKYAKENGEHEAMMANIGKLPPEVWAILATDSVDLPNEIIDMPIVKVLDSSPLWAEVIWRTTFGVGFNPDLID